MKKYTCEICKKEFIKQKVFPLNMVRDSILNLAKESYQNINENGYICDDDLKILRTKFIENNLKAHKGDLSKLDEMVINSLKEYDLVTENINKKFEKKLSFGEKIADKVALFGGSWKFIIIFILFIVFWMTYNTISLFRNPVDPYPYILLNLILSSLAAIQAPVIMMSQNRQSQKDRMQSDDDYLTNLKSELEIRQLHIKLDQFMKNQWDQLLEIQQIQIDLAEELLKNNKFKKK
jgi:uncharacterized membrane protein